jgi:hypothetical protein
LHEYASGETFIESRLLLKVLGPKEHAFSPKDAVEMCHRVSFTG